MYEPTNNWQESAQCSLSLICGKATLHCTHCYSSNQYVSLQSTGTGYSVVEQQLLKVGKHTENMQYFIAHTGTRPQYVSLESTGSWHTRWNCAIPEKDNSQDLVCVFGHSMKWSEGLNGCRVFYKNSRAPILRNNDNLMRGKLV